jgi:reverse gyrase
MKGAVGNGNDGELQKTWLQLKRRKITQDTRDKLYIEVTDMKTYLKQKGRMGTADLRTACSVDNKTR